MTLPLPIPDQTPTITRVEQQTYPQDDQTWLQRIIWNHEWEKLELQARLNYYNGLQPLSYMHPELINLIGDRVRQLVLNWPRLVVDTLEQRVDFRGFRFGGKQQIDKSLREIFQYNQLDRGYQMAHIAAMVMRRAYTITWMNPREPQYPRITVESPLDVHVELDPYTHQVIAAVKRWQMKPDFPYSVQTPLQLATLYRPDHITHFVSLGGGNFGQGFGGYEPVDVRPNPFGRVPVVPIVNRPQLWAPLGVSELDDVIPISDAACKIATDMMVSAEFHAMPRRWALGMDEDDFTDTEGNRLSTWQAIAGKLWTTSKTKTDDGVELGQFAEADLRNFHDTLRALATQVGAVSGVPLHDLGYSSDNPASAEAINASADRQVRRAERFERGVEQGWEETARMALLVRDGDIPDDARFMETLWDDPSTPTFASKADAVTKLYQADHLVTRRQARRTLGYTDQQIADMEAEDKEDASRVLISPADMFGPKPAPGGADPASGQQQAQTTQQPTQQQQQKPVKPAGGGNAGNRH